MKFFRFCLVAIILLVLGFGVSKYLLNTDDGANSDSVESSSDQPPTTAESTKPGDNKAASDSKDGASKKETAEDRNTLLKTKDLSIGASKKVQSGNKVSYHVFIQLMDGKVVFNSRSEGRPWTGTVGDGSILSGIDSGMRGMYQGGKRAMWIPARLGYGRHGMSSQVPPNADLYAEVEIVSVF